MKKIKGTELETTSKDGLTATIKIALERYFTLDAINEIACQVSAALKHELERQEEDLARVKAEDILQVSIDTKQELLDKTIKWNDVWFEIYRHTCGPNIEALEDELVKRGKMTPEKRDAERFKRGTDRALIEGTEPTN